MSHVIVPTVGRIVWYRPSEKDKVLTSCGAPLAARVAGVIPLTVIEMEMRKVEREGKMVDEEVAVERTTGYLLNIAGDDFIGQPFNRQNVPLLQDGEACPADWCHCQWMPYQVGQAAKQSTDAGASQSKFSSSDIESNFRTLYKNGRDLQVLVESLAKSNAELVKQVHDLCRDLGEPEFDSAKEPTEDGSRGEKNETEAVETHEQSDAAPPAGPVSPVEGMKDNGQNEDL